MKFMRDNDIDVASYAEVANLSEILEEISKDDPNGNICWLDSGKYEKARYEIGCTHRGGSCRDYRNNRSYCATIFCSACGKARFRYQDSIFEMIDKKNRGVKPQDKVRPIYKSRSEMRKRLPES